MYYFASALIIIYKFFKLVKRVRWVKYLIKQMLVCFINNLIIKPLYSLYSPYSFIHIFVLQYQQDKVIEQSCLIMRWGKSVHSRTGSRRNSGRREPVESATEMKSERKKRKPLQTADGRKSQAMVQRWGKSITNKTERFWLGKPLQNARLSWRLKVVRQLRKESLEIVSNHNTRQMIV